MNVIEVRSLTKSYNGKPVLEDLCMLVKKGDIYGFLGPNGVGKTTTLRMLIGLVEPDAGEIRVLEADPRTHGTGIRSRVGVLPENPGFYGWMGPLDNLFFYAELCGVRMSVATMQEYLKMVGLDPADNRPVSSFSRGMKQRLGLARTLVHDPDLLILDEPTSGLDPTGRREIHALLRKLNREKGKTIIFSSHILDDVERLCSSIGILYAGKLQYQGPLSNELEITYLKNTGGELQ